MNKRLSILLLLLALSSWVLYTACSKESANAAAASPTGQGGSLARFTIAGDYLYAVENHFLYAYSLRDPLKPEKVYTSPMNYDIETIYAYRNNLFLGTRTGLYIYNIDTAYKPRLIGEAHHARSCDPVVVNDTVAFVTLKSNANCGPAVSGLYIHDIRNLTQPVLKKTVELPEPVGLGLQGDVLYVCCGSAGLKVFNVKAPFSPSLIDTKTDGTFVDVIPYNGVLICYVQEGIILYDISHPATPVLLNRIAS